MAEENVQPNAPVSDWVSKLTQDLSAFQAQLQTIIQQQTAALNAKDEETFVRLYLEYNEIEREITDRQHVMNVLEAGEERFTKDLYKSEFWSYLIAAETVSQDLVNVITEKMRAAAPGGFAEAESYDEFQAAYKNYILPGKVIAGRFDELDTVVDEMNAHIQAKIPTYDRSLSLPVLPYAISLAIDSDTENEPVKEALETRAFRWLQPEETKRLLKEMEEQMGYVAEEQAKNEKVARQRFLQDTGQETPVAPPAQPAPTPAVTQPVAPPAPETPPPAPPAA